MANGHVEIHDPFSNLDNTTDPKATDSDSMEDTAEFRLLMAYAKRRRPQKESPQKDFLVSGGPDTNESSSPQTPDETQKEKKKKKKRRRMKLKGWRPNIFSCIKPQTGDKGDEEDKEPSQMNGKLRSVEDRSGPICEFHSGKLVEEDEEEEFKETAHTLTKIADEIPFVPPGIEPDSPEGEDENKNVEKIIGLLLRDAGDRLHEKELKDADIASELFRDYGFFKLLMSTLLTRMGLKSPHPDSPGPKASPKTQIAVACEVTSRLSEVNSLPRNRLLDHGARYLQHYYSSWVQQQGGYVEAFYSDDEDDE
ncbi:apoptosis facilitator Bcl-2-like protein 14 [Cebidichthys violaceus]|uniref:apoptosis facilitator Bcl-2-like protein 14 n=1 Tax=Cebidichthys violaceus TaxID=271503 RepID=UPI0035CA1578